MENKHKKEYKILEHLNYIVGLLKEMGDYNETTKRHIYGLDAYISKKILF